MPPDKRPAARRGSLRLLASWLLPSVIALGACSNAPERSAFEARVRGRLETTMHGGTSYTPNSLTLTNDDGSGAVVFDRPEGGLMRGVYEVGSTAPESTRINALVITGTPSRPAGVFRGRDGTLTVTTATDKRLAGHFDLTAAGVLTDNPTWDSVAVHVSGSFLVLEPCTAAIGHAAPCARPTARAGPTRRQSRPSTDTTTIPPPRS